MTTPKDSTAVILPVTSSSSSSRVHDDHDHDPISTSTSDVGNGSHGKRQETSWKPTFNRQQSWNSQDMKREMQQRLLQTEKGKELGYTEAAGEKQ
jgi:hypothetical protein